MTSVSFNLTWENAWKNEKNYDAAWIFIKFIDSHGNYIHSKLNTEGHVINGVKNGILEVSDDKVGAFIRLDENYRGNVNWEVDIKLDTYSISKISKDFKVQVFGLEMVYIPRGNFYLGATEPEAVNYASFYESDESGNPMQPYLIDAEDKVIKVSPTVGNLYYRTNKSPYRGDSQGVIPAAFPKGYEAFYIMKYETTQGFYANFLNACLLYTSPSPRDA